MDLRALINAFLYLSITCYQFNLSCRLVIWENSSLGLYPVQAALVRARQKNERKLGRKKSRDDEIKSRFEVVTTSINGSSMLDDSTKPTHYFGRASEKARKIALDRGHSRRRLIPAIFQENFRPRLTLFAPGSGSSPAKNEESFPSGFVLTSFVTAPTCAIYLRRTCRFFVFGGNLRARTDDVGRTCVKWYKVQQTRRSGRAWKQPTVVER